MALAQQSAPAVEIAATVCPHDCPSTCALEIELLDARTIGRVRGAAENSYTAGKICAKVARYAERTHHPDRLTQPLRRSGAKGSGEFAPISTAVPGLTISELLPKTAALAENLCLLRAVRTGDNAHSSSSYYMMTGVPNKPMNAENVNPGAPNNWPNFASVVRHVHGGNKSIPAAVRLPHHIWNTDDSIWPGQDAGFLGSGNDPWLFRCEPASPEFKIPEFSLPAEMSLGRVQKRRSLLGQFDRLSASMDQHSDVWGQYDGATRQAFDLLTSAKSRAAFQLADEPAEVLAGTLRLKFDSSWRREDTQTAIITVSYDGGEPFEVLRWESEGADTGFLKDDATNESVNVDLQSPEGATEMVITFGMVEAGNDWWWAIDNVEVVGEVAP